MRSTKCLSDVLSTLWSTSGFKVSGLGFSVHSLSKWFWKSRASSGSAGGAGKRRRGASSYRARVDTET